MYSKSEYIEKTKKLINIFCYSQIDKLKIELANPSAFKYIITDVN